MKSNYDEEEKETVLLFCEKCRQRVPDDVEPEETITRTRGMTMTITREYCPNCGSLVLESEDTEMDGGCQGSSGNPYGTVIVLPDGYIAVYDEEELAWHSVTWLLSFL